jgi:hypothetical protein
MYAFSVLCRPVQVEALGCPIPGEGILPNVVVAEVIFESEQDRGLICETCKQNILVGSNKKGYFLMR